MQPRALNMKKTFVIVILSLFITVPSLTFAEVPEKLKPFIEELESIQDSSQGGAIAIIVKGNVVYKKVYGNKKGLNDPITEKTLFGLASVSKSISAVAVALLVEKGQLSFEDKIRFPFLKNELSFNNILSHTTGYKFTGNAEIEQGMTRKKLLATLQKRKAECRPGECYKYSNFVFSLIDEALHQKGSSLNSAIINLNTVLKTQNIKLLPIESEEDIAYPHSKKHTLPFPSSYQKTVPASAGVLASLDDMIEFFKLSFGYRPDLISQATLDKLFKPRKFNTDVFLWNVKFPFPEKKIDSYYGLGWRILKVNGDPNADLIFHSGYIDGARAFIGFIPSQETGLIILSNDNDATSPMQNGINFWGAVLH